MITIQIYADAAAVAKAAARLVYERLAEHEEERKFLLALSGGSTPRSMYAQLRDLPKVAELLNHRAEIFFSDERAVPPDSDQSNYRAARVGLLEPLNLKSEIVHRLRGEAKSLEAEALRYEHEMRAVAEIGDTEVPRFDLVLLGIGPDGHTASLFADHDWRNSERKLVASPFVGLKQSHRLTFTLRMLNAARTAVFLATGADKADAIKKVLSAEFESDMLPARRVEAAETIWLLDQAAADKLNPDQARGTIKRC
ncbi:MAG: 6-phosphogluconolactonase [candidate division Zixibacteria bacterium]|nr:6-phosphogluconolactonase [candidate division Zixibacteria bacterium]